TRTPVVDELELLLLVVVSDEHNRMAADHLRAFLRKGDDAGLGGLRRHPLLVHLDADDYGIIVGQRSLDCIQALERIHLVDPAPRGGTHSCWRFRCELSWFVRPGALFDGSLLCKYTNGIADDCSAVNVRRPRNLSCRVVDV